MKDASIIEFRVHFAAYAIHDMTFAAPVIGFIIRRVYNAPDAYATNKHDLPGGEAGLTGALFNWKVRPLEGLKREGGYVHRKKNYVHEMR